MSSFTHPHVIPNLYDFLYVEHEDILKKNTFVFFFVHKMKVNGAQ